MDSNSKKELTEFKMWRPKVYPVLENL